MAITMEETKHKIFYISTINVTILKHNLGVSIKKYWNCVIVGTWIYTVFLR